MREFERIARPFRRRFGSPRPGRRADPHRAPTRRAPRGGGGAGRAWGAGRNLGGAARGEAAHPAFAEGRAVRMVVGGRRLEPRDLVEAGVVPPWSVEEQLSAPGVADRPVAELLEGASPLVRQLALAWLTQIWAQIRGASTRRACEPCAPPGRRAARTSNRRRLRPRPPLARSQAHVRLGAPVETLRWRAGAVAAEAEGASGRREPPSSVRPP